MSNIVSKKRINRAFNLCLEDLSAPDVQKFIESELKKIGKKNDKN